MASARAFERLRPEERRTEAASRLSIVSARRLKAQALKRRVRALSALAGALFAATLLIVVASQALLTSEQMRLDQLTQAQFQAATNGQNLELERSQLSSPTRILNVAEQRLKMISPTSVTYLEPVKVGPPLSSRRAS